MATTTRPRNALPTSQSCPICKTSVRPSARYPTILCADCANKATDAAGRNLTFYNTEFLGHGFQAVYTDDESVALDVTESHIAWVDGRKVWAEEAYFGGIVIFEKPETPEAREGGGGGGAEAAERSREAEETLRRQEMWKKVKELMH